jgi:transcriptional regulator with XRE-family HTH domain
MKIKLDIQYKNEKLQQLRYGVGLSQSQLATAAELSPRTIQHFESGQRDINGARLSTLLKLCAALRCKLADLVSDDETLELLKQYDNERTKI